MLRVIIPLLFLLLCCQDSPEAFASQQKNAQKSTSNTQTIYQQLLDTMLADGFDYPFGDGNGGGSYTDKQGKKYNGWYIATHTGEQYSLGIHTGEDWNGNGGGNTDLGQPVYATAKGKVIASADFGSPWGNIIVIEHRYLYNAKLFTVFSVYAHLEKCLVKQGDVVARRKKIGSIGTGGGVYPAHLHFEIRKENMREFAPDYWPSNHGHDVKWVHEHYETPSQFIDRYRKLLVPAREDTLLIAVKHSYRMKLIAKGQEIKTYTIGLGQEPIGHKQKQGDNRTPEGEYKIIQKALGPFQGTYGAYLGKAWMRINYPNNVDAAVGLTQNKITKAQYSSIVSANKTGKEPLKTTALGGGIGIHGWAGNWPGNDKQNLTWGCISVQNTDLLKLYNEVPLQTVILILP